MIDKNDDETNVLVNEFRRCEEFRSNFESDWKKYYQVYSQYNEAYKEPEEKDKWKARVFLPNATWIHQTAFTHIANNVLDPQNAIVTIKPLGKNDHFKVAPTERTLRYQIDNMNFCFNILDTIWEWIWYGDGFVRTKWSEKKAIKWRQVPDIELMNAVNMARIIKGQPPIGAEEAMSRLGTKLEKEEIVTYDGPDFDPISTFNVYIPPGYRSVADAPYVIVREFVSKEDYNKKAKEMKERLGFPALKEVNLDEIGQSSEIETSYSVLLGEIGKSGGQKGMPDDKKCHSFELLYFYYNDRTKILLNREHVVYDQPNIYRHGEKPILQMKFAPRPFETYSDGMGAWTYEMVNYINDKFNLITDYEKIATYQPGFINQNAFEDPDQLQNLELGAYVRMKRGWKFEEALYHPPIPSLPNTFKETMEYVKGQIQLTTGLHDYLMGIGGDSRDTATGVALLTKQANNRLGFHVRMLSLFMCNFLRHMIELNHQFLRPDTEMMITDEEQPFLAHPSQLVSNYDIRPVLDPMGQNDPIRKKVNSDLLMAALGEQQPIFNRKGLWKGVFERSDINPAEFLLTPEEEQQQQQAMQQQQAEMLQSQMAMQSAEAQAKGQAKVAQTMAKGQIDLQRDAQKGATQKEISAMNLVGQGEIEDMKMINGRRTEKNES